MGLGEGIDGMCSWAMGVDSGGRWGESCSRRGPRRGIFRGMVICVCVILLLLHLASQGMVICVCVIAMRASLASPSRLTGMVICVCVIAIVEERGECRFWIWKRSEG